MTIRSEVYTYRFVTVVLVSIASAVTVASFIGLLILIFSFAPPMKGI